MWRVGEEGALDFWERRLAEEGIEATRSEHELDFCDPEGLAHRLSGGGHARPPLTGESPEVPAEYALQGFDGVHAYATDAAASSAFLADTLGHASRTGASRWEARGGLRGGWYQLDPAPPERRRFGGGVVQHIAWGCLPEDIERLERRCGPVCPDATGIIDRHFFRSTYFTEPGGVLFEIAEHGGPGFAVGEPDMQRMGRRAEPAARGWRSGASSMNGR